MDDLGEVIIRTRIIVASIGVSVSVIGDRRVITNTYKVTPLSGQSFNLFFLTVTHV